MDSRRLVRAGAVETSSAQADLRVAEQAADAPCGGVAVAVDDRGREEPCPHQLPDDEAGPDPQHAHQRGWRRAAPAESGAGSGLQEVVQWEIAPALVDLREHADILV